MKISISTKNSIIKVISYLYILLFVYASVSKLLDYENFRLQLGQSPLIGAYAEWFVWLVPLLEIFIAVLLLFNRLRFWGMYAGYILMLMFTAYIFIMLNYSSYVPCSCGGVLEKLEWTEHLIFNGLFVILALLGLILMRTQLRKWYLISN